MKRFRRYLFFPVILLLAIGVTIFLFHSDDQPKKKENTLLTPTQPDKAETENEEKTEEKVTYPDDVFKILDFDRRLILKVGVQDKEVCSIFTLAYARAILDENFNSNPYDYYDGDGAVWRWANFADIASSDPLLTVLQRAYDEIDEGRPLIFYVDGLYAYTTGEEPQPRTSGQHFVLIIGYRLNADYDDLKPSDFYAADPSGGYCCSDDGYMPWVILTDDSPLLMGDEYALFAESESTHHLKTCIAYPDRCRWDADTKEVILPNYYEEHKQ